MCWQSTADLAGERYGRLLVLHAGAVGNSNGKLWLCRCDCGAEIEVRSNSLRFGRTRSCGCLLRDSRRVHNEGSNARRTPEYRAWAAMIQRCCNVSNSRYSDYGGRGIDVCVRWRRSYLAFLEDMGRRPSSKHSIDRIDNNSGYRADNCRWATASEQNSNNRGTTLVTLFGEKHTLKQWAELTGRNYYTLCHRIMRGMPARSAILAGPISGRKSR